MRVPAARPQEKGEPTPARPDARESHLAALCWPHQTPPQEGVHIPVISVTDRSGCDTPSYG